MEKEKDVEISAKKLAEFLSITERRLEQLAKEGMPKLSTKLFPFLAAVQWYLNHLRVSSEKKQEETKKQKEKLLEAKIKRIQLENARLEYKSLDLEAVRQSLMDIVQILRTDMLSLGGRLAPKLEGIKDAAEIKSIITGEVERVLIGMAKKVGEIADDKKEDTARTL